MSVELRPLAPGDFPLVERLFGRRGACGGCWCMNWRVEKGGKTWDAMKGDPAKREMARLVGAGRVHAVLGLAGGAPVGWCCIGPREDFPRLLRSRVLARGGGCGIWAVTCFFLDKAARGRGLGTRLLAAGAALAFARGAREIEGYPAAVADGARLPAPFVWTGTAAMFERAGFTAAERPAGMRPIYVKRP